MNDRAAGPSIRRRWQRFVLRLQGQLDGETADRLLPWALAFATFVLFLALDAAAERSLDGGSGLGPWLQAVWRRDHGGAGHPMGGLDPAHATWAFVAEPVLQLGRLVSPEAVFAVVQAAALAIAIVPLWRLARDEARLRVGATSVVIAAYALAPALHRANLTSFHPEAIALPLLLWAYLQALRSHWYRYGVLVAAVLLCGASLGLTIAGLGLVLFLTGYRRPGWITALVGIAWSAVAVLVLDPQLPTGTLTPAGEFVARATGPLAVVPQLLTDPVDQLRQLVAEPAVLFLVLVLAPLLFLPMVAPRKLSGALPCLALAMIADGAVQDAAQRGVINLSPAGAHIAPALAFVFIALVAALERIGEMSVSRVNVDRRVLFALLAGASLFFLTEAPTSPYRQPWAWGSQDAVDGARLDAADLIQGTGPVAVSPSSTSLVAERPVVHELPIDADTLTDARVRSSTEGVEWVLLDTTGSDRTTGRPFWTDDDADRVLARLRDEGFRVVYAAQGVYLLQATPQGS
ncbi:DUF2079 domain-containing protein [Aquihabitans sp. McL0605]|uniref:DUF2079 domain-containing protein n=1 Tax=Aquihabitans sp. McL0605 TaxID=3415671 RepID=UPI003CF17910